MYLNSYINSISKKIIFVLTFFALSAYITGSPVITLIEKEYDFGNMVQGDKKSHNFIIKNSGSSNLVFGKISVSCGCTAGILSKKVLKPDESGELSVTFDSEKFSGKQKKSVTINSNDLKQPFVKIFFTANVKKVWSLEPSYIKFYSTKNGKGVLEKSVIIRIKNLHNRAIEYININSNNEVFSLNKKFPCLECGIKQGKSFEVVITPIIEDKIRNTIRGFMDIDVGFADGRKMHKRVGTVIKKWRTR